MRAGPVLVAGCLAVLAGCTSVGSSGVVAMGPDTYGMKVVSRNLAGAAEKGLGDATTFCNSQGRQTQLLRTLITPDDYQLVFRCMGGAPQVAPPPPVQVPTIAGIPIPNPSAPVLAGPAFAQNRIIPADPVLAAASRTALPSAPPILVGPTREAPVRQAPPLPPLSATPVGASLQPLASRPPSINNPPLPSLVPQQPYPYAERAMPQPDQRSWVSRNLAFWRDDAPGRPEPLPATSGLGLPLQPVSQPVGGLSGFGSSQAAPLVAPLPAGNTLQPLQSPLAPIGSPAVAPPASRGPLPPLLPPGAAAVPPILLQQPGASAAPGVVVQPVAGAALPPILATPAPLPAVATPVAPALAPLPTVTPAPIAAPARRLDEVPLQPLPRLRSDVPATLPPPAAGEAGAIQPVAAPSITPPTGFWETRR